MRILFVVSVIISLFIHTQWDKQAVENIGMDWVMGYNGHGTVYDMMIAGPARQYLNIMGINNVLSQLLAGMVPYIGGSLLTQIHPMWIFYGGILYEISGFTIYTGSVTIEKYWVPHDGMDNLGEDMWNGIVKYSGPFKVIVSRGRDMFMEPVMNKLNQLYKLAKDAIKSFFHTMSGMIDQVFIFFRQSLPRMVKDTLGVPFKKFKNVLCEVTNNMGWLSKSKLNEKLRIMLGCDKHLAYLEKSEKLGEVMWCDSEGCMLDGKDVHKDKLDSLIKLLNQQFKELHKGFLKQRLVPSARYVSQKWNELQRKDPNNYLVRERLSRIKEGKKRRKR